MGVSLLNFFYLKPLNTSKRALNTNHPFFWDTLYIKIVFLFFFRKNDHISKMINSKYSALYSLFLSSFFIFAFLIAFLQASS